MNKKRVKLCLIVISLVSAILFCGAASVSAADKAPSFEELVAAQARAVAANEVLMQYFFDNGWITHYPEYYSGRYIKDNVLHICLASPTEQEKAVLDSVLANYKDVIIYEYRQYSHSELMEYTGQVAAELEKQGCEVTQYYVDSITGNTVIGVLPEDIQLANVLIEKQHVYARGNTLPKIEIEESEYVVTGDDILEFVTEDKANATVSRSQTVSGGNSIEIDYLPRSVGVCGYYGGSKALISCGHSTSVGDEVKMNGVTIGTVVKAQYTNGGLGDYSIIRLNNAEISHKIGSASHGYVVITGGTYNSPAVGTYVTRYGYNTGYSYGIVSQTNVIADNSFSINIYGLTKVTINIGAGGMNGDSGGPYLAGKAFCGVHHGADRINSRNVYFTPYSVICADGFTAIGTHDCASWTDTGPTDHSGYCIICQETVYEAHYEHWNSSAGRCIRCGRTDPINVPGTN